MAANGNNNWKPEKLENVCALITDGKHGDCQDEANSGFYFLSCKDVADGKLNYDGARQITEADFLDTHRRTKFAPSDILITNSGTIGRMALAPDNELTRRTTFQKSVAILKPVTDRVEPRFLYYALQADIRRLIEFAGGTAQKNLLLRDLRAFEVRVPTLPAQRRIAGILSAYDELIENSQRRIKILEAMARALYREWFVHFRFPGHENVPRVASPRGEIPEGWEVTEIAKVCVENNGIQTGPFGSQLHESDYANDGVPVVMPKDLIGFRIRTDSIARIPEETANKLARHRMQPGDIVYGRRGDIGRRAYLMPHQAGWFCGTGCLRIRPNPEAVSGWYLFNYLGQDDIAALITGRAHGVTMPNLNTGIMVSVPIVLPPRSIQEEFSFLTFPMSEEREALTAKIQTLRRTRDLLLPRLLSGQVELASASVSANGAISYQPGATPARAESPFHPAAMCQPRPQRPTLPGG